MEKWLAIPGNRERKAAYDKAYWENNKKRIGESRSSPEYLAARAERIRKDRANNPEKYRKAEMKKARANGVLPRKEAFATKVKATLHDAVIREKARTTLKQKGAEHPSARVWSLISPSGLVFQFKNLVRFVESHSELFTEDQLTPVSSKKGRPCPRVARSLSMLSPRKKHPCETMHGWRWYIDEQNREIVSVSVKFESSTPPKE